MGLKMGKVLRVADSVLEAIQGIKKNLIKQFRI